MKLIYGTLGAMLAELRERKVEAVRIARFIQSEAGRTTGIPWYASRIVVTAPLDGGLWAECRLSAGRGMAELAEGAVRLPEALRQRGEKLLAEVKGRVDAEGFRVLDGMLTHDSAAIDGLLE
jgi:hypothetical protein